MNVCDLYRSGLTVEQSAKRAGLTISTARRRIFKAGIMRPRTTAIKTECVEMYVSGTEVAEIAEAQGCCKQTVRTYLRDAGVYEFYRPAKGVRISSNGYIEYTRGEHQGRSVHVVEMESRIGRRLKRDEVVHHIDGDKKNNDINNLALMTRSAHARLHSREDKLSNNERERDSQGRFK